MPPRMKPSGLERSAGRSDRTAAQAESAAAALERARRTKRAPRHPVPAQRLAHMELKNWALQFSRPSFQS